MIGHIRKCLWLTSILAAALLSCGDGTTTDDDGTPGSDTVDATQVDTVDDNGTKLDTLRPDDVLMDAPPDAGNGDLPGDAIIIFDAPDEDTATPPRRCMEILIDDVGQEDRVKYIDFGEVLRGKSASHKISLCNRCPAPLNVSPEGTMFGGVCNTLAIDDIVAPDGAPMQLPESLLETQSLLFGMVANEGECMSMTVVYDTEPAHTVPSNLACVVGANFSNGIWYAVLLSGTSVERMPYDSQAECIEGQNNCHVDGQCVAAVAMLPDYPCRTCQPQLSETSNLEMVTLDDGRPCDDDNPETLADSCQDGSCVGQDGVAPRRITQLAAGDTHTCGVDEGGHLFCWGNNDDHRCGQTVDDEGDILLPTLVQPPLPETAVAGVDAGTRHTCAVTDAGDVFCFGDNSDGQLGCGNTDAQATPVEVTGLGETVSKVSCGARHTCALMRTGTVKCWGFGQNGRLGNDNAAVQPSPVSVALPTTAIDIGCGSDHCCVVGPEGQLYCWGDNSSGQVMPDGNAIITSPVQLTGIEGGAMVTAGNAHTCVRDGYGHVQCIGDDSLGQLGDGGSESPLDGVALIAGSTLSISAGHDHTCAVVMQDQSVYCWGANDGGQLGNRSILTGFYPVAVLSLFSPVTSVAAGLRHSCAAMLDGGIRCWGNNDDGQLGTGDRVTIEWFVPIEVVWPPA